jgi:hypothetical protein
MPDTKITALAAITTVAPANDLFPIVDVSDNSMAASGTTKNITVNQLLGAGGTATLASATITGDLTVDTSTLKVDSTNNRVGIVNASPAYPLDVVGNINTNSEVYAQGGRLALYRAAGASYVDWSSGQDLIYRTVTSVGGSSPSELMRLNSTGLGVGRTPVTYKFEVLGNAQIIQSNFTDVAFRISQGASTSGNTAQLLFTDSSGTIGGITSYGSAYGGGVSGALAIGTGGTDRLTIASTGNVGVGVVPSAWASGYKCIQGQIGGFALSNDNSSNNQFRLSSNAYFDTTDSRWEYFGASTATAYEQRAGEHRFFNAISGSANTLVPFVQAMTLDASGSLHVGTTAYIGVASKFVNSLNGFTIVPDNTANAANRNWNIAANGGAAGNLDFAISSANNTFPNFAYRMQLTSAGALNNTTGTYGTISDLRLKENISDARNYLADLLKLRVVKYSLKEESSAVATKLGFIAQEVELVFPNLVDQSDKEYDGAEGIRSVKTSILIPMLLKAIQELTARVQTLEAR